MGQAPGEFFDAECSRAQAIDLLVDLGGAGVGRGNRSLGRLIIGRAEAFGFDLCGELLEFAEQLIDGRFAGRGAEQFAGLPIEFAVDSLGAGDAAKSAAEQGRLQAFVLQAFFALAELLEPEGEDRLEQVAIGVADQPLKAGFVELGFAAVDLDADFVFVSLAAAQFDHAGHRPAPSVPTPAISLPALKVVGGAGGKIEEPAAEEFEQGGFARFVRAVDDLQPGLGERRCRDR